MPSPSVIKLTIGTLKAESENTETVGVHGVPLDVARQTEIVNPAIGWGTWLSIFGP